MQVLKGKGKIYDIDENYMDEVAYEIHQETPGKNGSGEWRGEITLDNCVKLTGKCIIELDDGRRVPCLTIMKTTSSFDLAFDHYEIQGAGALTRQNVPDMNNRVNK
jgi:hypothetical protein